MVPFARRVRTIGMCSLDARGEGPSRPPSGENRAKLESVKIEDEASKIVRSSFFLRLTRMNT